MKIGIIGAGFTGLAAGYELSKKGHQVFIFESLDKPGGLAIGFENKNWKFSLEKHYHHLFANDYSILNLAQEIGHKIIFNEAKTSTFINQKMYQLDSPLSLLKFSPLTFYDKLRVGITLLYLRTTNNWKSLEGITTQDYLIKTMGENAWTVLWKPLMVKKFGKYYSQVAASWFWARIKKRTVALGYPYGGFLSLAKSLEKKIKKNKGIFYYSTLVEKVQEIDSQLALTTNNGETFILDKIICTLPVHQTNKILPQDKQIKSHKNLKGVGAINLIVSLSKPFFKNKTYWLNINHLDYPFLAVVEHTNLISNKFYNGEHIMYIGNYLERTHKFFSLNEKELLGIYLPFIKKINPNFQKKDIKKIFLAKADFAQPVIKKRYSRFIPKQKLLLNNMYLTNIQQVYPWDRGTNYAVEMGLKIAQKIVDKKM